MFEEYQQLFSESIFRTIESGITISQDELVKLRVSKKRYSQPESKAGLLKYMFSCLGNIKPDDINGNNGIQNILRFKPYLEDYLDTATTLTIGGVNYKGKLSIDFGTKEVRTLLYDLMPDYNKINVHVWLTLPTLEIIDLTFLEMQNNQRGLSFNNPREFEYIFDSLDNISYKESITYKPMLLGCDSLYKLDLVSPKLKLIS
ncbi:MAG: hypothetical protein H0W73_16890 [Bacteroidetes bacterium]|nr:hypothetical protein [Bacteroidota bacterium]